MKKVIALLIGLAVLSIVLASCGGGGGGGGSTIPVAHVAFVTSTTYTANLGGIAGADAKCQARANAAGLPGTFKAWISDSTTDAYCHIHNLTGKKAAKCGLADLPVAAGPWNRTDGTPFAPTIDKLTASIVYTPLIYDEFGVSHPSFSNSFTNTDVSGVFQVGYTACADWTDGISVASLATGGIVQSTIRWAAGYASSCNANLPLICLQTGAGPPLSPIASTGKKAFVTSTFFTGSLGGLTGADASCQARATAGGLANASKFKAWLSDGSTDAVTRLSSNGPWFRIDGIKVAGDKADLTDGTLFTAISQDEMGNYTLGPAWTGTNLNGTKTTNTCNSWTDGTGGFQGQIGLSDIAIQYWTNNTSTVCSSSFSLYCFEDQ